VVLADEPSGNLDHFNGERLHQLFATLSREFETALIAVTHNWMLASRADRVLMLEEGRLVPHISADTSTVEREKSS
jgi:ABC-type lipoprotein export system ATPase subunit